MGTPIKRSIRTIQQHQHCTVLSTTSTMKIAIVSLVLVAAVSINGNIDKISKGATDLNTMEKRLQGLQTQKDEVSNALKALTENLDKKDLGTNSKDNTHKNLKWDENAGENGEWKEV